MYHKVLRQMQACIQHRLYRTKIHVDQELVNDDLTTDDIRRTILNGGIIRRKDDEETGGYQYLIKGRIAPREEMVVVARIELIDQVEWTVIITVYRVK